MDRFLHFFVIPCAEIAAYDNAGAHAKAHEKAGHHENQVSAAGNRRKGFFSDKVSYYYGVGGVIKLLGEVTQKHGNGEFQYSLPGRAKGHVLGGEQFF